MGSTDALRRMSSVSALSPCTVPWHPSSPEQILIGKRRHAWQAHFHWLQFTKKQQTEKCLSMCVCVVGGGGEMWRGRKCPAWTLPVWQLSLLRRVTHFSSSILGSDKFLKDCIRAETDWPPVLSTTMRETMNTGHNIRLQTARSTNTKPPWSQEASVMSSSTPVWFSQPSTLRGDKKGSAE